MASKTPAANDGFDVDFNKFEERQTAGQELEEIEWLKPTEKMGPLVFKVVRPFLFAQEGRWQVGYETHHADGQKWLMGETGAMKTHIQSTKLGDIIKMEYLSKEKHPDNPRWSFWKISFAVQPKGEGKTIAQILDAEWEKLKVTKGKRAWEQVKAEDEIPF